MAYTVKEVAKISGVSVRTLHHYDEVDLLKPAFYGSNGYRYYEEEELLLLQQILFFRKLGFELKQIQKILKRNDFDKIVALRSHKQVLQKNLVQTQNLIKTIDQTINHLQGKVKMKEQEFYYGFNKEQSEKYEKELIGRFGEKVKAAIAESNKNVKGWTQKDWELSGKERDAICKELSKQLVMHASPDSEKVQQIIQRHYDWVKTFWTPTNETYALLGELYMEWDVQTKQFTTFHPELAVFMASAMKIFAKQTLARS